MAQATSHKVSSSGLGTVSEQLDQYLTAVQLTSADMAPAMPHSSCLWKQKSIVYSLQLVWLMWQYVATKIQHNQKNYII